MNRAEIFEGLAAALDAPREVYESLGTATHGLAGGAVQLMADSAMIDAGHDWVQKSRMESGLKMMAQIARIISGEYDGGKYHAGEKPCDTPN